MNKIKVGEDSKAGQKLHIITKALAVSLSKKHKTAERSKEKSKA